MVGKRVRRLREERGWSMGELSRRSDVPTSTISRFERGKTDLGTSSFLKITRALRTSDHELRYLIGGPPFAIL